MIVLRTQQQELEDEELEHEEEIEADRYLQLDEFYVAVARTATMLPSFANRPSAVAAATSWLCSRHVVPFCERIREQEAQEKSAKEELLSAIPGVDAVIDRCKPKLEKIFRQIAASGGQMKKGKGKDKAGKASVSHAEREKNRLDVDAKEFLQFCKAIRAFDATFSMSSALDIFVYCNNAEIVNFLVQPEPMHDLSQELRMELDEFMQAFMILGATKIGIADSKKKRSEEFRKKFEKFCDDLIEHATKEYSHIQA